MINKLLQRLARAIRTYRTIRKWRKGPILTGGKFGVRRAATFSAAQDGSRVAAWQAENPTARGLSDRKWDPVTRSWI